MSRDTDRVAAVQRYGKDAYRDLIRQADTTGWSFGSFLDSSVADRRTIYLRHDVDYSLELAVELAELNHELGIPGTFCVQLRAQFYNVFERTETRRLLRLRELGQWVGLHYVIGPEVPTAEAVSREFELLGEVFPDPVPVFSWHQPSPALLESGDFEVSGLVNAYGRRFFLEMPYLSDSTHRVSAEALRDEFEQVDGNVLQLLLHPVNWVAGGSSGAEILVRGWNRVLRDHERTLLANRTYSEALPKGVTAEALDALEEKLLCAVERSDGGDLDELRTLAVEEDPTPLVEREE